MSQALDPPESPPALPGRVVWAALTSRQAHLAIGGDCARRFPADVAPFLGLRDESPGALAEMNALAAPGEILHLIGHAPRPFPGWAVEREAVIAQMAHAGRPRIERGPEQEPPDVQALGLADSPEMQALMAEVYPGYFRPRTPILGRYLGIRVDGRLVAMAGERLSLVGHREISGVATRPEFRGRGLAGRLVDRLVGEILRDRLVPFLHVDADNTAAIAAYRRAGFVHRRRVDVLRLRRLDDRPA